MKKLLVAPLLLAAILWCPAVNAGHWGCEDEDGNPIPCEKDEGGSGGGGDPCSISQKGYCRFMTIYPGGHSCEAGWCEADPAAWFKCASYNTPTCEQGTNPDGSPIFVMINDCASCWG